MYAVSVEILTGLIFQSSSFWYGLKKYLNDIYWKPISKDGFCIKFFPVVSGKIILSSAQKSTSPTLRTALNGTGGVFATRALPISSLNEKSDFKFSSTSYLDFCFLSNSDGLSFVKIENDDSFVSEQNTTFFTFSKVLMLLSFSVGETRTSLPSTFMVVPPKYVNGITKRIVIFSASNLPTNDNLFFLVRVIFTSPPFENFSNLPPSTSTLSTTLSFVLFS